MNTGRTVWPVWSLAWAAVRLAGFAVLAGLILGSWFAAVVILFS